MEDIVSYVGAIPVFSARNDDDFATRLNHRFTTAILMVFAFVVGTQTLVGDQIKCWVPAHFSDAHEAYTDTYCWIKNTYYLPFQDYIPHEPEDEKRHMIQYYQWVPFILAAQAFLFYLPISIWRHMNRRSGMDVDDIVATAEEFITEQDEDEKKQDLEEISDHFNRYLARKNEKTGCTLSLKTLCTRTCCFCCASRGGSYLVSLYLFVKFLFVVNVIGQLFILNGFLGKDFDMYGIEVLGHIINGTDWKGSRRFPRITFCDLKVRRLGNVQRYTVQCVLPINLFNEMIYLFVWFWMVFVAAITVYSFFYWTMREVFKHDRVRFIKKNLSTKLESEEEKRHFARFITAFLRHDGIFVLRLIEENANKIVLGEVLDTLWKRYQQEQRYIDKGKELEETGEGTLV